VNQLAQHALVGETLQVGAGLTEPAPDAFDVPDPETLSDKGVQVDAAGDDVASSLRIPELVAVGRGEFVEHFGLDKRQVVADAVPAAWGEGTGTVGVSVAVQAHPGPTCDNAIWSGYVATGTDREGLAGYPAFIREQHKRHARCCASRSAFGLRPLRP
jgi:hypothetical protein